MQETLLSLFAAHLVADFLLQPDALIRNKKRPAFFAAHIALVAATAALFLGGMHLRLLAALAVSHALADAIKTYACKDTLRAFLLDQIFHLAFIVALALRFPDVAASGIWPRVFERHTDDFYTVLAIASFFLVNVRVGAILIAKICGPLLAEVGRGVVDGLGKGGLYIGMIERSIVFLLIGVGQPGGVGFLLAAKSILRFGDLREAHQIKATEYIIIGTLLSFGWALACAYAAEAVASVWAPEPAPAP